MPDSGMPVCVTNTRRYGIDASEGRILTWRKLQQPVVYTAETDEEGATWSAIGWRRDRGKKRPGLAICNVVAFCTSSRDILRQLKQAASNMEDYRLRLPWQS